MVSNVSYLQFSLILHFLCGNSSTHISSRLHYTFRPHFQTQVINQAGGAKAMTCDSQNYEIVCSKRPTQLLHLAREGACNPLSIVRRRHSSGLINKITSSYASQKNLFLGLKTDRARQIHSIFFS